MNAKPKFDFKSSLNNNAKSKDEISVSDVNIKEENEILKEETNIKKFTIGKKQDDKIVKKPFPLYMEQEKTKKLDRVVRKTGYSRNEIINMMIDFCLENIEFEE